MTSGFWTEATQRDLSKELTGYWAADIWDLRSCPGDLPKGFMGNCFFLKFECPSQKVKTELKYFCRKKIIQGEWKVNSGLRQRVHCLVEWMRACLPASTQSLLERDLADWEQSYRSFRVAHGRPVIHKTKRLRASQQFQECTGVHGDISLLRQLYRELETTFDTRAEYDKDVWDFRLLGVRVSAASTQYKVDFTLIGQPWLRQLAKTFFRSRLAGYSAADSRNKLRALTLFSEFLATRHPQAGPQQITRKLMIEYFGFLLGRGLSPPSRANYITGLRTLLELSVRMGWGDLPKEPVIYDEDFPRKTRRVPRFIPDQVLEQIFLHLEKLEPHWQRMFLVAYEVGLRMSELLALPYHCLTQDATGGWWITYVQWKGKTEHRQFISKEVVAVIQTQQQEAQVLFGANPKFLFPNSKGKSCRANSFRDAINRFILHNDIRDASGMVWRFQPHQLRHSFGTRHINEGMPPALLMRLMGHRKLGTTLQYAHLHNQTLRTEFEKSSQNHKLVDITGRVISEDSPVDAPDLQWLKSHLAARTLPNGFCGIPVALGPCPFPNSCLSCPHFRTDKIHLPTHEAQLAETIELIQIARAKGWKTQVDNNELIAHSLTTIITSLKEPDDDAQT